LNGPYTDTEQACAAKFGLQKYLKKTETEKNKSNQKRALKITHI
jgi:hypothetical protein